MAIHKALEKYDKEDVTMETNEEVEKFSICPFMSNKTDKVPCMKSICVIYDKERDQCDLTTSRVLLEDIEYNTRK